MSGCGYEDEDGGGEEGGESGNDGGCEREEEGRRSVCEWADTVSDSCLQEHCGSVLVLRESSGRFTNTGAFTTWRLGCCWGGLGGRVGMIHLQV